MLVTKQLGVAFALMFASTLAFAGDINTPFSKISNVRYAQLHRTPTKYLVAVNPNVGDVGGGALWGEFEDSRLRVFDNSPEVSLFQVDEIRISGDDKYAAVVTTGEGHPALDIFLLKDLFEELWREETPPAKPIASYGAYPYGFIVEGWAAGGVVLSSKGPLDIMFKCGNRRDTLECRTAFDEEAQQNTGGGKYMWEFLRGSLSKND